MIRRIFISILLILVSFLSFGQEQNKHIIMFYNVENLFDIYDDPVVRDDEFTPDGPKEWTDAKYRKKLGNIEEVIYSVAASKHNYPAIIGVSEIENRRVLDDLVSTSKLARANYQIVHYDSPEARGVDVALLYRPDIFKYEKSDVFQPEIPERPGFKTRDILAVYGRIEGELFCFFVNHWSSRIGGAEQSEFLRVGCAQTLRDYADSIQVAHPDIKIVIMGDMNDDPKDRSLSEVLGAKEKISKVKPGGFFNPFWSMQKAGYGTLGYQDSWSLFDNMVINYNLLPDSGVGELKVQKGARNKFYGTVFKRPFMVQEDGKYKNYPWRTFSGNTFLGGYSDHVSVYIEIGK